MKELKKVIPLLIVALTVGLVYSFFNIDGREIKNIKKLSSDCRVSVIVNDTYGHDNRQEYELNDRQIEELKNPDFEKELISILED